MATPVDLTTKTSMEIFLENNHRYGGYPDEESCVEYLERMNVLKTDYAVCENIRGQSACGGKMKKYNKNKPNKDRYGRCSTTLYLRCTKKGCQTYRSLRNNLPVIDRGTDARGRSNNRLALGLCMQLVWCWTHGQSLENTEMVTGTSRKTTVEWFQICRDVAERTFDDMRGHMGGPAEVVRVFVTKFDYRQDRGPWTCGMSWDRDDGIVERRFFKVADDGSLAEMVARLVRAEIRPGTTVMLTGIGKERPLVIVGYKVVYKGEPGHPDAGMTETLETRLRWMKWQNGIRLCEGDCCTHARLKELWWRSVNVENVFNKFWLDANRPRRQMGKY